MSKEVKYKEQDVRVTIRMPVSLKHGLVNESIARKLSLNGVIVTALARFMAHDMSLKQKNYSRRHSRKHIKEGRAKGKIPITRVSRLLHQGRKMEDLPRELIDGIIDRLGKLVGEDAYEEMLAIYAEAEEIELIAGLMNAGIQQGRDRKRMERVFARPVADWYKEKRKAERKIMKATKSLDRFSFDNKSDWLKFRHPFISGSNIALIMGHPKAIEWGQKYDGFDDPLAALRLKKRDKAGEDSAGLAARVGLALEEMVGDLYSEEMSINIERPFKEPFGVYVKDEWALASPDFIVVDDDYNPLKGLDVKTTRAKLADMEDYWQWQARWYMYVMGFDHWDMYALHLLKMETCCFSYTRDKKIEEDMVNRSRKFLELVWRDEPFDGEGFYAGF